MERLADFSVGMLCGALLGGMAVWVCVAEALKPPARDKRSDFDPQMRAHVLRWKERKQREERA